MEVFTINLDVKRENKFKRAINTYPEINSKVYQANETAMQIIMNAVSKSKTVGKSLEVGHFASNKDVAAVLDGNRFFQRHACIVGSTGSGKSYTVASILERQISCHMQIWLFSICMESIMSSLMQTKQNFWWRRWSSYSVMVF